MHGPEKLFASSYSNEQLAELAHYIKNISIEVNKIYVYFDNDFHGYALNNAKTLMRLCGLTPSKTPARLGVLDL